MGWTLTREREEPKEGEMAGAYQDQGTLVLPVTEPTTKVPSLYKVFLHNDDYTPMEFVVEILESIFHKANTLATQIMLDVHKKGSGLCGIYPYEVAETKVALVKDRAKQHRHPLKCTMEEE